MSPTIVADLIIFFPRAAGVCVCAWKSEHLTTTGQISKKNFVPPDGEQQKTAGNPV
jgi:hypothetical protein